MTTSRAQRRKDRELQIVAVFGKDRAPVALDLLELVELAWHDCYSEVTPSKELIDDMLLLSDGSIETFVQVARLAVADWRDLKVAVEKRRG